MPLAPASPEAEAAAPSLLSMVRSMPFSRQSCRLRRKRLRLLDMEGEGGGDDDEEAGDTGRKCQEFRTWHGVFEFWIGS